MRSVVKLCTFFVNSVDDKTYGFSWRRCSIQFGKIPIKVYKKCQINSGKKYLQLITIKFRYLLCSKFFRQTTIVKSYFVHYVLSFFKSCL